MSRYIILCHQLESARMLKTQGSSVCSEGGGIIPGNWGKSEKKHWITFEIFISVKYFTWDNVINIRAWTRTKEAQKRDFQKNVNYKKASIDQERMVSQDRERAAVSRGIGAFDESIVLATCQIKYSEKEPPSYVIL